MGYMPRLSKPKLPNIEYLGEQTPDNPTLRMLLRERYFRVMPNHRHHRVIMWSVFLSLSTVLAVQFAYPLDHGLPFARLGTQSVILQSDDHIAKLIADQFDHSEFKFVVGDKTYQRPLKVAGAEPDTAAMITQMVDYPFWQRFIPFSIVWQPVAVDHIPVVFSPSRLDITANEAAKALSYPPSDAVLAIKDGSLKVGESKSGYEVSADAIKQGLTQVSVLPGAVMRLNLTTRELPAKRSLNDLATVLAQAEAALATKLVLRVGYTAINQPPTTVASWLAIGENDKGSMQLTLADTSIDAFVGELNKQYGVAAGTTNVTVVNGRETARTVGESGRTVDAVALKLALQRQLIDGGANAPIDVSFLPLTPTVVYNNTYSATREGLQSYINDISVSRNMHVMIQQLDGEKWAVEARAHESIPSGSTYKLFVALELFDRMDKDEIDWGTPILDTDTSGCFERMTVASTNPCAEEWLAQFGGYSAMNDFVYSRGFSHETDFTNSEAKHTSAADLTRFMIGLENGTVLHGAQRDKLLDSLWRHPYKYGIPTGSKGKVWDKVGFLWDYVHDTAIVHHPSGTYVMTIMSKGQSYASIATVTREIERIMYP